MRSDLTEFYSGGVPGVVVIDQRTSRVDGALL
jgi:hypothetical protein